MHSIKNKKITYRCITELSMWYLTYCFTRAVRKIYGGGGNGLSAPSRFDNAAGQLLCDCLRILKRAANCNTNNIHFF